MFPFEIPSGECSICLESCRYDDIFIFDCDSNHKSCYKCYEQSCTTKMNNNEILTCILCSYPLSYNEVKQIRVSSIQRDLFVEYQMQKTFERYKNDTRGIIKCPSHNCTWIVENNNPNERVRVNCQLCDNEFCSLCNQQYHYRTDCQQLSEITQQWFFWCDSGRKSSVNLNFYFSSSLSAFPFVLEERSRYLSDRTRVVAAYANRLAEYERQQPENQQRNEELRRRYGATMTDEAYKAEHCRLCPHCGRVVQHMGGCSSMICGQDFHGGNLQSGCGQSFTWNTAKPYVVPVVKELEEFRREIQCSNSQVIVHENSE